MPARPLPALRAALAVLFLLCLSPAFAASELRGRVVGIADGDTLTLLTDTRERVRVRLFGIDTPERRQPDGSRARQALAALAFGRPARVEARDVDRYGRTVGVVSAGGAEVNAKPVRRSAAWVYRRYSQDPALLRLEAEAREARRGL